VCVTWVVSNDDFKTAVSGGEAYTSSDVDYTVKVEAQNLSPDTKYKYQFADCGKTHDTRSPIGNMRTLPVHDGEFRPYHDESSLLMVF
jgi:alkaline phosphatase D